MFTITSFRYIYLLTNLTENQPVSDMDGQAKDIRPLGRPLHDQSPDKPFELTELCRWLVLALV